MNISKIQFLTMLALLSVLSCAKESRLYNSTPDYGISTEITRLPVSSKTAVTEKIAGKIPDRINFSEKLNPDAESELNKHLIYILSKGNYKGLSAAVSVKGKGLWKASAGNSGTDSPLSPSTAFHAFSVGKIITSALMLKICEERNISTGISIQKWFPEFPNAAEITLLSLLNHTSGIQTYEVLYEFIKSREDPTPGMIVEMSANYGLRSKPGDFLSYSNTGYIMIGMIIESELGISLDEAVENYFIIPLGLKNTLAVTPESSHMKDIAGFSANSMVQNFKWPLTYGAGPIMTNPEDALRIFDYILSGDFISTKSINKMFEDMNHWKTEPDVYYGKGIYMIKNLPGGDYIGHSGGSSGFRTCLFYNTGTHIMVSVMTNCENPVEPAMFSLSEKAAGLFK